MKRLVIIYSAITLLSCSHRENDVLLSPEYVNLKGKESLTIFRNSTLDTLRLTGEFFNYLPYSESTLKFSIAPNQQDTLKFNFTFPDFIHIYGADYFRVFNSPGKILYCDILNLTSKSAKIIFKGELADINEYYLAYHNQMGSRTESNRPYYEMGDRIEDFNNFPSIVDSISQLNFDFYKKYNKPLPNWFKKHEKWRLKYHSGYMKQIVLHSKRFYSGKEINVSENYFSFEKELPFENKEMILNSDYLWYIRGYIDNQTRTKMREKESGTIFEFQLIDSLFKGTGAGDIFKMDKISMIYYAGNIVQYDTLFDNTIFIDNNKKHIIDSLVHVKFGLPVIGKIVPELPLINLTGEKVSLNDFRGSYIIVNFWATWCGACIQEFSEENKLYMENKDKGLNVINVCLDSEINQWKTVSKMKELKTINLFTEKDQYQPICKEFGISGLPKSILLDKNLFVLNNNSKRASMLTTGDINEILKR